MVATLESYDWGWWRFIPFSNSKKNNYLSNLLKFFSQCRPLHPDVADAQQECLQVASGIIYLHSCAFWIFDMHLVIGYDGYGNTAIAERLTIVWAIKVLVWIAWCLPLAASQDFSRGGTCANAGGTVSVQAPSSFHTPNENQIATKRPSYHLARVSHFFAFRWPGPKPQWRSSAYQQWSGSVASQAPSLWQTVISET